MKESCRSSLYYYYIYIYSTYLFYNFSSHFPSTFNYSSLVFVWPFATTLKLQLTPHKSACISENSTWRWRWNWAWAPTTTNPLQSVWLYLQLWYADNNKAKSQSHDPFSQQGWAMRSKSKAKINSLTVTFFPKAPSGARKSRVSLECHWEFHSGNLLQTKAH